MLKFEVAKFMDLFENGKQPHVFDGYFHYMKDISSYNSRIAERNDFYLPLFKTKRTQQSIKFLGVKNLEWNISQHTTTDVQQIKQNYKVYLLHLE